MTNKAFTVLVKIFGIFCVIYFVSTSLAFSINYNFYPYTTGVLSTILVILYSMIIDTAVWEQEFNSWILMIYLKLLAYTARLHVAKGLLGIIARFVDHVSLKLSYYILHINKIMTFKEYKAKSVEMMYKLFLDKEVVYEDANEKTPGKGQERFE